MKHSQYHPEPPHHEPGRWAKLRHALSHLTPFGHSHESSDSLDDALESSKAGIRALKISLVVLMLTALFQLGIVAISGSVALLADTIHNFSDALTALPLWLAFALSRRAANKRYTYGYGRAEDLAGLAIVGFIFFSACVAGYESVVRLISGSEVSNLGWVAAAAGIGFVGNELVAKFRIGVGRRIGSAALVADGQHARVDGFTSLAVLLGAAGVALGYPILDPLIGLLITVAIMFIVKDSARSVWRRMMDGVEPEIVSGIEQAAALIEGVKHVESVRARWIGHRLHSELRIQVDGGLSVDEGEKITERVRSSVRQAMPKLDRVAVEISALERPILS